MVIDNIYSIAVYELHNSINVQKFVSVSVDVDMGSTSVGQIQHGMAVLRDQYSYLADVLVPEDILPKMFARKLITKSQKQKADSHLEKYRKNQILLDSLLARREVGAFQRFCDALSATSGQEYIADRLKECKLTYVSKIALVSQISVCNTIVPRPLPCLVCVQYDTQKQKSSRSHP